MLLNRHKSVALAQATNKTAAAAGFNTLQGDRYLGVHLSWNGKLSVLSITWEKLQARAQALAGLPISLWGKMTLIRAYLRPKILYQLVVVKECSPDLDQWLDIERRLLNSSGSLSSNSRRIVSEERTHYLTWARLPPLLWDLDRRRLGMVPLLHSLYNRGGGRIPLASQLAAQGLLQDSVLRPFHSSTQRRLSLLGATSSVKRQGKSIIFQAPPPILARGSKKEILSALSKSALAVPLMISPGQAEWTTLYNTDWPTLWTNMNRTLKRVRSPVASFVWRLLNRSLPWATYSLCPLCAEDKASINHMFIKCPALAGSFTPNPLVTILSPPHASNKHALLALWALWKTICWVQHSSGLDTKTVDLSQVAHQHYHLEVNRA